MLTLATHWIWDFWIADDGTAYHLFFLKAPRVGDPDQRHWNVCIGHAVSPDLRSWEVLADAIQPSSGPAFDDYATWTGSVVKGDDGLWHMFYTGLSHADSGQVQRIGVATSPDLHDWTKRGPQAVVTSGSRWYEQYAVTGRAEHWRDPWVIRDPDGDGWHMVITAAALAAPSDDGGVLGHAHSTDLISWEVRPPLSQPGSGFSQLEVPQVVVVDGNPLLLFNCLAPQLSPARRKAGESGGVWVLRSDTLLGPYDVSQATRLTDESLYVGKLVQRRDGHWALLAFVNQDAAGAFVGSLSDPLELPQPLGSTLVVATHAESM
ncbi:MAG TPA: glycosyl hydrolase family 32 [Dermatophilaceae bacterium]|nr:glycosyl hydrolase family 32 [Dermatophilaceae bacterium]